MNPQSLSFHPGTCQGTPQPHHAFADPQAMVSSLLTILVRLATLTTESVKTLLPECLGESSLLHQDIFNYLCAGHGRQMEPVLRKHRIKAVQFHEVEADVLARIKTSLQAKGINRMSDLDVTFDQ